MCNGGAGRAQTGCDPIDEVPAGLTMRAVVTCIEPEEVAPRSLLAANAITGWLLSSPRLGNAVMLMPAAEPLPCRLSTQQLVELLKMPTCVGEARTVILELLANRYRQPFADVWEFVEWA